MKIVSSLLAGTTLLCSLSLHAAPENIVYEFKGFANSYQPFTDLQIQGEMTGELETKFIDYTGKYAPSSLTLHFPHLPRVQATHFIEMSPDRYVAHVEDTWIFRSIAIEINGHTTTSAGFGAPHPLHVSMYVDYKEDFIGSSSSPYPEHGMPLADIHTDILVQKNSFSPIDVYETTYMGKKVTLTLNKFLTRKFDPQTGMLREGFELQVIWFGHGEGVYYFPHPIDTDSKPFAILSDAIGTPESIAVQFRESGNDTMQTYFTPLDMILNETFQPW